MNSKFVWNSELKDEYLENLQQSSTTEKLFELNSNIACCIDSNNIESCLSDFVNILDNVSAPLFKKKICTVAQNDTESDNLTDKNHTPWYNQDCKEKTFYIFQMLNKYRNLKNDDSRRNMLKARSDYKSVLRKSRYDYDKKETDL